MELSAVLLNWNAAAETITCVQQMAAWRQVRPTVWVVDNASTDDSPAEIAARCPQVRLIRNAVNLGYAGGNNRGVAAALAQGDAPVLLQNNDAEVSEATVIRLLETLRSNPRLGVVGPLLYDARQPARLLAAGGRNIAWHINSHLMEIPAGGGAGGVDYVPGTVMLVRAEMLRQVGLLDEAYFFTGEIPDLCQRAKLAGFDIAVDSQAQASHAVEKTSGFRETLYPYYIIRNRFLFVRKFYPRLKWPLYGFWSLYGLALSTQLRLTGRPAMAAAVWRGCLDGLSGRFGGQNQRVLALTTALKQRQR